MAVQPDTTTGTLTTTSGSLDFTTSGTQLLTRGHMPGDRFLVNGLELQIDTITGENSGTLTELPPTDAVVTGFPVRLRFQPDGARVAAQTRNLIDLLGNGTLQSLTELDGSGGDKGIVFTGPSTTDTFALTSFARTLLALNNDISVLDNLFTSATSIVAASTTNIGAADGEYVNITGNTAITSFGSAALNPGNKRTLLFSGTPTLTHSVGLILPGNANIIVEAGDVAEFRYEGGSNWRCIDYQRRNSPPSRQQSSVTDATAGREMIVGAFGLGGTGPAATPAGTPASDIVVTGQYYGASWADMPVAGTYTLWVLAQNAGSGRHVQIAWQHGTSDMYYRMSFGGVYGSWMQLNVIRGSNANGEYVRFPDGTQICWGSTAALAHTGNVELTTNINLPISFLATAEMKPLLNYRPASTQAFTVGKCHASASSTGIIQVRSQFSFTQSYTIDWYVIGRWK